MDERDYMRRLVGRVISRMKLRKLALGFAAWLQHYNHLSYHLSRENTEELTGSLQNELKASKQTLKAFQKRTLNLEQKLAASRTEKEFQRMQEQQENLLMSREKEWSQQSSLKLSKLETDMYARFVKERSEWQSAAKAAIEREQEKHAQSIADAIQRTEESLCAQNEYAMERIAVEYRTEQKQLQREAVNLKGRLDAEVKAHESTAQCGETTYNELSTKLAQHRSEQENILRNLKSELENKYEGTDNVIESLRKEVESTKNSYVKLCDTHAAAAAAELAAKEYAEDMEEQLGKSEEARRSLRSTVKKVTRELVAIRSTGHQMQETAHMWERKAKATISLRLKYEALQSEYKELRQQVHEFEWGDPLPGERSPH
jgi:hypothetical protein